MPESEQWKEHEPQSYFGRKLAADPELRARCEQIAEECRRAVGPQQPDFTTEDIRNIREARIG